jgi:hypothetical protein
MKKLVLGALAMFIIGSALVSCKGGKSDEQIAKEAKDQFEKDKEVLTQQADAECQKVIETKYDSIKTVKAEEAKAEEEAKTKKKGK